LKNTLIDCRKLETDSHRMAKALGTLALGRVNERRQQQMGL